MFTVVLAIAYHLYPALNKKKPLILLISGWLYFLTAIRVAGSTIHPPEARAYTTIGTIMIVGLLIYYYVSKDSGLKGIRTNHLKILLWTLFITTFLFIAISTSFRYLTFMAPAFDFGIFTQMFEYMRTTGLPNTTVERDILLSHFAVHLSPVYYLILPIYMLFPSPITLQVMQALIVSAGIFPLYKLCRQKELQNIITLFILVTFAFYPALSGGCMYDIHENMFLTVFLLWLFYFLEKAEGNPRCWLYVLIFSALTFTVKEDAPIYIAVIGLYVIFNKKKVKEGALLFITAVIYFAFAIWFLGQYGQGVMLNSRFGIYAGDDGFTGLIKTILTNPFYIIKESMTESKVLYIMRMLLPLAFLPLLNKKPSGLILIIPFILKNLMPSWIYQHDIGFQYNFGNCAIFFYLFVMNVTELKSIKLKKFALIFAATASIFMFNAEMLRRLDIVERYRDNEESNAILREVLAEIPKDKSVSASTFFVPHLYQNKELYELRNNERETDYIIIDLRFAAENEALIQQYKDKGYEVKSLNEGLIAILSINR
jgi:uncharacterized membrane protein